jgi:hypothetical protein
MASNGENDTHRPIDRMIEFVHWKAPMYLCMYYT